jgi:uncharacterized tellurite resistance protein B-like protein
MTYDQTQLFHNLVNLAAVDQKFTEEEIAFLIDRANKWGIPSDEFETAMVGLDSGEIQVELPEDHDQKVLLLKEMIRLMAADGEMAEMEKSLCARASAKMDFNNVQFGELLEEVIREQD